MRSTPTAIVVPLAEVEPQPVRWLWPGRIALGKLTIISGDPGLGKSFLTLDLAARVSIGCRWPDDCGHAPLGSVVLLSAEDDLADTIRPRLDAAGADVTRVVALQAVRGSDESGSYERAFDLSRDAARLEEAVVGRGDCRLIVIDPISCYLGRTKSHDNGEVRGVLAPLAELAGRLGVAVVAVSHLRKGEGQAIYRTMGSLAFVAAARAAYAVVRLPGDKTGTLRAFLPLKNNIGDDRTGLAYKLVPSGDVARLVWEEGVVEVTADEAMAPPERERRKPGPEPVAEGEAESFLRRALAGGPRLAKELLEEAREAEGLSRRTIERAKKAMGVQSHRPPDDPKGPWSWKLPGGTEPVDPQAANQTATTPSLEQLGDLGGVEFFPGKTAILEPPEAHTAKLPEPGGLARGDAWEGDPDEPEAPDVEGGPEDDTNAMLAEAAGEVAEEWEGFTPEDACR